MEFEGTVGVVVAFVHPNLMAAGIRAPGSELDMGARSGSWIWEYGGGSGICGDCVSGRRLSFFRSNSRSCIC